jgi:hypothetical protein
LMAGKESVLQPAALRLISNSQHPNRQANERRAQRDCDAALWQHRPMACG